MTEIEQLWALRAVLDERGVDSWTQDGEIPLLWMPMPAGQPEMVHVSGEHYVWLQIHWPVTDPGALASRLIKHLHDHPAPEPCRWGH